MIEPNDFPIDKMKAAEEASKGSFDIILKHIIDKDRAELSLKMRELDLKADNSENNYNIRRLSIYAGMFMGGIASGLGGYGIYLKADPVLLGTALAFISGIAGVFLWGYQRKD